MIIANTHAVYAPLTHLRAGGTVVVRFVLPDDEHTAHATLYGPADLDTARTVTTLCGITITVPKNGNQRRMKPPTDQYCDSCVLKYSSLSCSYGRERVRDQLPSEGFR